MSQTSQIKNDWIKRRAKLFEAGDYPDKGLTVTPDHLKALAATFTEPVPVLVEHADTPLEMGYLTAIECVQNELFGTLTISPEADALIEKSNAKSLSLGLAPDLSAIREVSVVRNPRIADARLFGQFCPTDEWRDIRLARVDLEIERWLQAGKIAPSQVSFARALLADDQTVEFDGNQTPVPQLVRSLIAAQPKLQLSAEIAPHYEAKPTGLKPEETSFYERYFPNLPLQEIAEAR